MAIWGSIPFVLPQIDDLCFKRAATCFLQNSEMGEVDRRRVLKEYLKRVFKNDSPNSPLEQETPILPTDNLIISRVINNLCTVYNQEPSRDFGDVNADALTEIIKDSHLNRHLKQAYKLSKVTNEVALRPYQIKGKWKIEILTPDLYRCKYDNNNEVVEMWIPYQIYDRFGNIQNRFRVWDKDTLRVTDAEGAFINFEENGVMYPASGFIHKYGRLPYSFLRMSENPDVYGGAYWELVKAQIWCNAIDYIAAENLYYNGLGIWYFQDIAPATEILLNPGRAFVKNGSNPDENPDIRNITGAPLYNDINIFKESYIRNTLKSLGLPTSLFNDSPGLQSGVAMKIDRMELEEYRRDDIDVLQEFEEDLLNLICVIGNVELNLGLPQNLEVNTDYIETQVFLEPIDEFTYTTSLYSSGLISPLQYLQRMTGNTLITSDEEAISFINKNKDLQNGSTGTAELSGIKTESGGGGHTEAISNDGTPQGTQPSNSNA